MRRACLQMEYGTLSRLWNFRLVEPYARSTGGSNAAAGWRLSLACLSLAPILTSLAIPMTTKTRVRTSIVAVCATLLALHQASGVEKDWKSLSNDELVSLLV